MRHSAALACGLLLPAALVLPVLAQDNEAEKLFRDMHKKLSPPAVIW